MELWIQRLHVFLGRGISRLLYMQKCFQCILKKHHCYWRNIVGYDYLYLLIIGNDLFCQGKRRKEKYIKTFSNKFLCTQLLWQTSHLLKKKRKEMLIYYVDRHISNLITSIYLLNNTISAIWNFWPPQTSIIKVLFLEGS